MSNRSQSWKSLCQCMPVWRLLRNDVRERHFRYETEVTSVGHAVEWAVQYAKTTCRVWQCHWRLLSATVYALQSMLNNHLSVN